MANFKKIMLVVCMVCILASVAMLCAGCKETPETTASTAPSKVMSRNYTITVRTAGGLRLDGVTVYVYEDSSKSDLADVPKKLDSEGKYSFVGPESDTYTVVLQGVPAGYDVQEQYTLTGVDTEILLTSAPIAGEAPANITYNVGDIIYDYTFTTIDGVSYTISDILKEKNAVVLNFWFVNCGFCKEEFPYLQAAYEKHGDDVEVLALDVENDSYAAIDNIVKQFGLTFPVAKVDSSLLTAMKAGACPTTVVVDRYGMISYLHTGALLDPAEFPALLRHFGADNYTQGVVKNAADLVGFEDIPYGCEQYPYEVGALSEFVGEVRADELVYYTLYRISAAILRIEDPDVYMVYEGQTYYPVDGVLEMDFKLTDAGSFSGVTIALGTTGGVDKPISLLQFPKEGSSEKPIELNLGNFEIPVDGTDAYYMFTAQDAGTLTITMDALPEGVQCRVNMTNLRTYAVSDASSLESYDPDTGKIVFRMAVEAGDSVRLIISAYGENTDHMVINALASIPEVEGGGSFEETPYSVFVISESGTPLANVELKLVVDGVELSYFTDETGLALLNVKPGTYSMTLVIPEGYYGTEQYLLTPGKNELDIMLVSARTYGIHVSITGGSIAEEVTVRVYSNDSMEELIFEGKLDENGDVSFSYGYLENCVAVLSGLPSNVYVQHFYYLTDEVTNIALVRTSIGDTNAANQRYHLGDKIEDFSITTPDGRTFTVSELLQEKKMLLLTFWHLNDTASFETLAKLQGCYSACGDEVQILAMNPMDSSDTEMDAFQAMMELSFPVASCSSQWEAAFQMTTYPTLVVIDRDGTICLIHSGALTDMDTIRGIYSYYTSVDYETTVVSSIEELLAPKEYLGTYDNPYVIPKGTTTFTVPMRTGEMAYLTFEEEGPLMIRVEGPTFWIFGVMDYPMEISTGYWEDVVNIFDGAEPFVLQFGNASNTRGEYVITITPLSAG